MTFRTPQEIYESLPLWRRVLIHLSRDYASVIRKSQREELEALRSANARHEDCEFCRRADEIDAKIDALNAESSIYTYYDDDNNVAVYDAIDIKLLTDDELAEISARNQRPEGWGRTIGRLLVTVKAERAIAKARGEQVYERDQRIAALEAEADMAQKMVTASLGRIDKLRTKLEAESARADKAEATLKDMPFLAED